MSAIICKALLLLALRPAGAARFDSGRLVEEQQTAEQAQGRWWGSDEGDSEMVFEDPPPTGAAEEKANESVEGLTDEQIAEGLYYSPRGITARSEDKNRSRIFSLAEMAENVMRGALVNMTIEDNTSFTGRVRVNQEEVDIPCMEAGTENGTTSVFHASQILMKLIFTLEADEKGNCFSYNGYPCIDGVLRTSLFMPDLIVKIRTGKAIGGDHDVKEAISKWRLVKSSFTRSTSGLGGMMFGAMSSLAHRFDDMFLPYVTDMLDESMRSSVTWETDNKRVRAALWSLRQYHRARHLNWRVTTAYKCH